MEDELENDLISLIQHWKESKKNVWGRKNISDSEFYRQFQPYVEKNSKALVRCFFESFVEEGDLSGNPFYIEERDKGGKHYAEGVVRIALNKIKGVKEKSIGEFNPVIRVVENWSFLNEFEIVWASNDSSSYSSFVNSIYSSCREGWGCAISTCHEYVYQGVPLYQQSSKGEFSKISEFHNDYIYIFMSAHYHTNERELCVPEWVKKYFFKNDHLELHKHFFRGFEGDDETLKIRRTAFRKAIGEEDVFDGKQDTNKHVSNDFLGNYSTKLMRIQKEVLKRFYGDQFDINDRDTWAKQNKVVDWLTTEFKLSKREAEAIDLVTRPDVARGK